MIKDKTLIELFESWSDERALIFTPLPPSGSSREYYRIVSRNKTAIGVFNPDKKENLAFISFSKLFFSKGLNVPKVYSDDLEKNIYLIEDLGDTTLFSYLSLLRKDEAFPSKVIKIYKRVLDELPKFQIESAQDIDYSTCYPRDAFDKQSMMWDLNYFKYYFLKLAKIHFDEQHLEDDFQKFSDYLLQADSKYFLYRDFQSRNIMIKEDQPYFIDYQGGRKGALHYDLASLLFDAKADIPQNVRAELLHHYIKNLKNYFSFDEREFIQHFFGFVLIRIMQAMGAYGYRGFYERKEHFLKSIPYAIKNLEWLLNTISFPIQIPALISALWQLVESKELKKYDVKDHYEYLLKVTINSFSFKKGIPSDESGNGGGFVFDCRAIHNPGRYEKYKSLNGKDKDVIEFLQTQSDIDKFLKTCFDLVDISVNNYQKRLFTNLMISFGCTGGQHRSVYCAEQLSKYLLDKYKVKVILNHKELNEVKEL